MDSYVPTPDALKYSHTRVICYNTSQCTVHQMKTTLKNVLLKTVQLYLSESDKESDNNFKMKHLQVDLYIFQHGIYVATYTLKLQMTTRVHFKVFGVVEFDFETVRAFWISPSQVDIT